jgi:antitoxin component of RelBE/YafQ-DinJ toxin-antitoxin module
MQTTLRIDDALYREAKAAAVREGVTLTSFIESALQLRLRPARQKRSLPVYDSGVRAAADVVSMVREANEEFDALETLKLEKAVDRR